MDLFELHVGDGPIIAAAIHSGHAVRFQVEELFNIDEATRLREEDPFTDRIAAAAPTRLVGHRSRFEMDLNRPRDKAVYLSPDDAWGLDVWRSQPASHLIAESLANYDFFYASARTLLEQLIARHGRVVVLDVHSYNHRRQGADGPTTNPAEAPEVNVGTSSIDRDLWGTLVDQFVAEFRASGLDVRENVNFFGGRFSRWVNSAFPGQACALAIEFKKTFMDEWTGVLDEHRIGELRAALAASFPGLLQSLKHMTRTTPHDRSAPASSVPR